LPQDFVRSVPELRLDVHVYSDERAQRFVVLNSRHYREGDHTHEGPRLEVITRDGAILSYLGRRFLVPVYH
jgi:general secretion pathway protein B